MKLKKMLSALLAAVLSLSLAAPAFATQDVPSPERHETPTVSAVDADGKDVTDILVLTPYRDKHELEHDYKLEHFEEAMEALTWDGVAESLGDTLTGDMDVKNLTAYSVFYVHEQDDQGIVKLPVDLTISTDLTAGSFVQMLFYNAAQGKWVLIPSTFHDNGNLSFSVNAYGPYAIITYRAQENPSDPTQPEDPNKPNKPNKPSSPQTSNVDDRTMPVYLLPAGVAVAAAVGMLLHKRKDQ